MSNRRTALVVEVPEAQAAVARIRHALDPNALRGVPPHFTLVFPFMPPDRVDAGVLRRLADLCGGLPEFAHTLVDTGWFGHDVLWLATDADSTVRSMTDAVTSAFPEYPPYEGEFAEVIPHLTIAERGGRDAMLAAETEIRSQLPIQVRTQTVTLLAEEPSGMWVRRTSFALGQAGFDHE